MYRDVKPANSTATEGLLLRHNALTIRYLDFVTGRTTTLFHTEGPYQYVSLTVSPDKKWMIVGVTPRVPSELMLVENFR